MMVNNKTIGRNTGRPTVVCQRCIRGLDNLHPTDRHDRHDRHDQTCHNPDFLCKPNLFSRVFYSPVSHFLFSSQKFSPFFFTTFYPISYPSCSVFLHSFPQKIFLPSPLSLSYHPTLSLSLLSTHTPPPPLLPPKTSEWKTAMNPCGPV